MKPLRSLAAAAAVAIASVVTPAQAEVFIPGGVSLWDERGILIGGVIGFADTDTFTVARNGYIFKVRSDGNLVNGGTVYFLGTSCTGGAYLEAPDLTKKLYERLVVFKPGVNRFFVPLAATGGRPTTTAGLPAFRSRESGPGSACVNGTFSIPYVWALQGVDVSWIGIGPSGAPLAFPAPLVVH